MTRQIGPRAMHLIKHFEGLRLKAYLCPAKVWTVGYGSTGPHVGPGVVVTEAQAENLLRDDLERFERGVNDAAGDASAGEFGAMVALAFNIGLGGFAKSSVLRAHRAGETRKAADAFLMWNKGGGKVLPGLTRRRNAERALYLGDLAQFDRLVGYS